MLHIFGQNSILYFKPKHSLNTGPPILRIQDETGGSADFRTTVKIGGFMIWIAS